MHHDNGSRAFRRDRIELMAYKAILHQKSILAPFDYASTHRNRIGIGKRLAEARLDGGQDGADAGTILVLEPVHLPEVLEPGIFEATEIDVVIDMTVVIRVHTR